MKTIIVHHAVMKKYYYRKLEEQMRYCCTVLFFFIINSSFFVVSSKLRLWVSKTCPYAARAWISCHENIGKDGYELKVVDLQNKPKDFNELYASISPWGTDMSSKVPILEDENGFRMIESAVIVNYINNRFSPSNSILNPEERAVIQLFIDTFDKVFGPLVVQILRSSGDQETTKKTKEDVLRNSNSEGKRVLIVHERYA
jgi:glutathione S-transferase